VVAVAGLAAGGFTTSIRVVALVAFVALVAPVATTYGDRWALSEK